MKTPLSHQVHRRISDSARLALSESPVVLLQGPRSVGKTTLLREIARETGASVIDLDEPTLRELVEVDPAVFVGGEGPVYIDEYQRLPIILDAIKAELNVRSWPGRFLITGSASSESLPRTAQSLTGRIVDVPIMPLTQLELEGGSETLISKLFEGRTLPRGQVSNTTREEYHGRVLSGGMPLALQMPTPAARDRWFDSYVSRLLSRDLPEVRRIRQPGALAGILERTAGQTAQVLNVAALAATTELSRQTASEYLNALAAIFLVLRLPAWDKTLRSRATKSPKIHVLDSGIGGRLLRLTAARLADREPTALSEFGHLLESFAVGEILRQASWQASPTHAGHWRTSDGDEVDLILEGGDGAVVAFEIKASARATRKDWRSLEKLRDSLGERYLAGVVLYLGGVALNPADRIHLLPADVLWT